MAFLLGPGIKQTVQQGWGPASETHCFPKEKEKVSTRKGHKSDWRQAHLATVDPHTAHLNPQIPFPKPWGSLFLSVFLKACASCLGTNPIIWKLDHMIFNIKELCKTKTTANLPLGTVRTHN